MLMHMRMHMRMLMHMHMHIHRPTRTMGAGAAQPLRRCAQQAQQYGAVEILLHETIGGGFSPPAVAKLHRHARSAASGTDRTLHHSAQGPLLQIAPLPAHIAWHCQGR